MRIYLPVIGLTTSPQNDKFKSTKIIKENNLVYLCKIYFRLHEAGSLHFPESRELQNKAQRCKLL